MVPATVTSSKELQKTEAKLEKKRAKAEVKQRKLSTVGGRGGTHDGADTGPSPAVRYAEAVRGILYVLTGASLFVALVLGQRGAIVSLEDLIDSLFVARTGKVALALIGAALLIYGMKHLRLMR